MHVTATELNKRPGTYLDEARREPVVVEKSGRPSIVMISYDYFLKLENAYWGELAIQSDKEKSLGKKKTMDFLLKDK